MWCLAPQALFHCLLAFLVFHKTKYNGALGAHYLQVRARCWLPFCFSAGRRGGRARAGSGRQGVVSPACASPPWQSSGGGEQRDWGGGTRSRPEPVTARAWGPHAVWDGGAAAAAQDAALQLAPVVEPLAPGTGVTAPHSWFGLWFPPQQHAKDD